MKTIYIDCPNCDHTVSVDESEFYDSDFYDIKDSEEKLEILLELYTRIEKEFGRNLEYECFKEKNEMLLNKIELLRREAE